MPFLKKKELRKRNNALYMYQTSVSNNYGKALIGEEDK